MPLEETEIVVMMGKGRGRGRREAGVSFLSTMVCDQHILFLSKMTYLTYVRHDIYPRVFFCPLGLNLKPGAIIDSLPTTPQTRGLSNLPAAPLTRGPVPGPPSLPPQPLMQILPSHVPPMLPSHAPQLGLPYSLSQLDCAPQGPIMTSVPPPAQTSLPPASIQSTVPMLQNPITMTKVSLNDTGKYSFMTMLRSISCDHSS